MTTTESKWLPIESAPKEHGEPILLCRWEAPPVQPAIGEGYWWSVGDGGYWAFNGFTPGEDAPNPHQFAAPTHWQPLPPPPNGDVRG